MARETVALPAPRHEMGDYGILAAVLTGQAHPLAGLMERLTIGQYLLFVLFIAARTIARPSPDGPRI